MPAFVCLFHGDTLAQARLVATSADPILTRRVASEMLEDPFCVRREADDILSALSYRHSVTASKDAETAPLVAEDKEAAR